jgi:sulfite reductase beta subunit-like hemoprotein
LPRKLKIAFAGCARDCSGVLVHDLGFIAQCKDGAPGFAVYLGGGLGARSRIADLFLEFIPARDAYLVAEAVKRVFDQHGNRRDRHRARLRFLVADLGIERFRALFEAQRSKLSAQLVDRNRLAAAFVSPPVGNDNTPSRWPSAEPNATCQWRARCVAPQRQAGLNRVTIALPLGDLKSETALALAGVVKQFGERTLRATQDQNLLLRSVRDEELDALHGKLATLGLAQSTPTVIQRMAACTGATTCKLGLCNSRGLATELARVLADSGLELDAIGDATIKISGCPNACGQHPIAAIGLVGAARHVGERLVPHYIVQLGGQLGEGKTQLATGTAAVSARHVPRLVKDLLAAYVGSRAAGGFAEFLAAKGRALVATLSQQYRLDATDQDFATHWVDWGADEPFSLSGRAGK